MTGGDSESMSPGCVMAHCPLRLEDTTPSGAATSRTILQTETILESAGPAPSRQGLAFRTHPAAMQSAATATRSLKAYSRPRPPAVIPRPSQTCLSASPQRLRQGEAARSGIQGVGPAAQMNEKLRPSAVFLHFDETGVAVLTFNTPLSKQTKERPVTAHGP